MGSQWSKIHFFKTFGNYSGMVGLPKKRPKRVQNDLQPSVLWPPLRDPRWQLKKTLNRKLGVTSSLVGCERGKLVDALAPNLIFYLSPPSPHRWGHSDNFENGAKIGQNSCFLAKR